MRPRTLRRRGRFYRRKRSHWRLNLSLVLVGVALAGFVVVGMRAGAPAAGPAEVTAKRIAALAPPPLPDLVTRVAGPAPDRRVHAAIRASRRDFDAGARLGVSTVRTVKVRERAPVPRTLVQPVVLRSPSRPDGCKACGEDVPF
jgi:hypothetical protein